MFMCIGGSLGLFMYRYIGRSLYIYIYIYIFIIILPRMTAAIADVSFRACKTVSFDYKFMDKDSLNV